MTGFRTRRRLALLLAATAAIASCGGGGGVDNELSFRIIQASPDTPLVNFIIDGVRVRFNVNFKGGFGKLPVTPGSYDIAVEAILPGPDELIIDMPATHLSAGKEYTYIVIGKDADDSVGMLEFENPIENIPAGNARVQLAHAAPDVGPVDIYFTAQGDILPAATVSHRPACPTPSCITPLKLRSRTGRTCCWWRSGTPQPIRTRCPFPWS
jgi:hypothetical protein